MLHLVSLSVKAKTEHFITFTGGAGSLFGISAIIHSPSPDSHVFLIGAPKANTSQVCQLMRGSQSRVKAFRTGTIESSIDLIRFTFD